MIKRPKRARKTRLPTTAPAIAPACGLEEDDELDDDGNESEEEKGGTVLVVVDDGFG